MESRGEGRKLKYGIYSNFDNTGGGCVGLTDCVCSATAFKEEDESARPGATGGGRQRWDFKYLKIV